MPPSSIVVPCSGEDALWPCHPLPVFQDRLLDDPRFQALAPQDRLVIFTVAVGYTDPDGIFAPFRADFVPAKGGIDVKGNLRFAKGLGAIAKDAGVAKAAVARALGGAVNSGLLPKGSWDELVFAAIGLAPPRNDLCSSFPTDPFFFCETAYRFDSRLVPQLPRYPSNVKVPAKPRPRRD